MVLLKVTCVFRKGFDKMIEIIKAIFYGIIEGITEWLPVSSTGHLILFENFWNFNSTAAFIEMFRVVIQLGAILAVVVVFFRDIWPFACKKKYALKPDDKAISCIVLKWDIVTLWFKIIVACLPAIVYGVLFDDDVSEIFGKAIGNSTIKLEFLIVTAMLFLVGILFIVIENKNKGLTPNVSSSLDISYKAAFIIGLFQLVAAILPGTSRSGATILGALMIGIGRKAAAEFTFYLAIPVMFGASVLKALKFIMEGSSISSTEIAVLVVGCAVAFFVSLFIIKFLLSYIKKHDFKAFGWYRIALGAVLTVYCLVNLL